MPAEVTQRVALSMQVCVPLEWSDDQVKGFADHENVCGTTLGWCIRRAGDPALQGSPERNPCAQRDGHMHIMLDA